MVHQLADKDVLVGVIVAQRGHPTRVVVERKDTKSLADFVRRAFAKVSGEVGGVGRAAAVAENKNLPVLLECLPDFFDELRDRVHRDGIVRGLLSVQIVSDPLLHVAVMMRRGVIFASGISVAPASPGADSRKPGPQRPDRGIYPAVAIIDPQNAI